MMPIIGALKVIGGLTVSVLCLYFVLHAEKQARQLIKAWQQEGDIMHNQYDEAVRKMTTRMRAGYGFLMVLVLILTVIYTFQLVTAS